MELDHTAVEEEQSAGNAGWNSIWCRVCKFYEWIAKGREMNDVISTEFAHWTSTCLAYVGPGSGVTMLWALLAILGGVLFMVFGLLFWPVRVLLRSIKKKKAASRGESSSHLDAADSEVTGDDKQTLPSSEHS